MEKQIILIATLDTKGESAQYLKECIETRNHSVLLLDVNTGGIVSFDGASGAIVATSIMKALPLTSPNSWFLARHLCLLMLPDSLTPKTSP